MERVIIGFNEKWLDPTPEMLADPVFEAIWNVIKTWDINVPSAYHGYCSATGNHVRAILDALPKAPAKDAIPREQLEALVEKWRAKLDPKIPVDSSEHQMRFRCSIWDLERLLKETRA